MNNKNHSEMMEQAALRWLSNEIKSIPNFKSNKEIQEKFTVNGIKAPPLCELALFKYSAKVGNSFGYWDNFPIVLLVRPLEDHFFGFNIHYFDFETRDKIIGIVNKLNTQSRGNKKAAFRMIYPFLDALVKVGKFNYAYKNYLYSNMESNFIVIHPDHYSLVSNLPIAKLKENNNESN